MEELLSVANNASDGNSNNCRSVLKYRSLIGGRHASSAAR
jgi:hypothetical protein